MSPSIVRACTPGRRVEGRLRVVGGEDVAAGLPQHGLPVPDRVFAAVGRVRPAELLLGRVGERLGGGAEVVPGPVRRGVADAGLVEELLVVDDGEVVDERRDADDLAVDGGRQALGRPEVLPVDRGVAGDQVVQEHDLGALDDVRHPRAEEVRDVRRLAAGDGGEGLLEGEVAAAVVQRRDLDVGVRLVPFGHQSVVRVLGVVDVPVPHGDVDDAGGAGVGAGRRAAAGRAAAGRQGHGREDEGQQAHDADRDAPHCLPPVVERHHDCSTTDLVRCRGRSGSRPLAAASRPATRWMRTSSAIGSSSPATTVAPVRATCSSSSASISPSAHTTLCGSATLMGPCRYSMAG